MIREEDIYRVKGEVSQKDRLLPALAADSLAIDDRSTDDLILFIVQLSSKLRYYNEQDQPEGDWEDFFLSDMHILYRLVSRLNLNTQLSRYENLSTQLFVNIEDNEQQRVVRELFRILIELGSFILKIRAKLNLEAGASFFYQEFRKVADTYQLDEQIRRIISLILQYQRITGVEMPDLKEFGAFLSSPQEQEPDVLDEQAFAAGDPVEKAIVLFEELDRSFAILRNILSILSSNAEYQLQVNSQIDTEKPHLILLNVFLKLYPYLQKEINALSLKHLDYYYRAFLKMGSQGSVADRAYILLRSTLNAPPVVELEQGTLFTATIKNKDKQEEQLTYRLLKDTFIGKEKISRLHSVFVRGKRLSAASGQNGAGFDNQQVYTQTPLLLSAEQIIKGDTVPVSWPLVGEDQQELISSMRTMKDASIGSMIASPLLYQISGDRFFECCLYPQAGWLDFLRHEILAYMPQQEQKADEKYALQLLFSEVFELFITIDTGWLRLDRKSISFQADAADWDKMLKIGFELKPDEPPVGIYRPTVHGLDLDEQCPILKILLHTGAFKNGYTFLRNFIVERIQINVKVSQCTDLKVQNNIGPLSTGKPFQLFGPTPTPGCYMDLINSNGFNRYTESLSVTLHWLDLPHDNLGFEDYYRAYDEAYRNDSFKIDLYTPAKNKTPENMLKADLFQAKGKFKVDGPLSETSLLEVADSKKLRFDNPMLMDKEAGNILEADKAIGVLRLELSEPASGFGHKSYTKIFPEIVLHNAKKKQKKALPNLPYIPTLKKIAVDYRLSQSELLQTGVVKQGQFNAIRMYQLLPFGQRKVYPSTESPTASLVVDFENAGNLYIGLELAVPGQELSLFFEIDENNYQYISDQRNIYRWSYLQKNNWKAFLREEIISDDTNGFLQTGIVRLKLPDKFSTDHTVLTTGLFWVRLALPEVIQEVPKVFRIISGVAAVERVLKTDSDIIESIPAGSIQSLVRKNNFISMVYQPAPSFGGSNMESDGHYYRRVSERLRHKNRAVTSKDIAGLILDRFPEIYSVKCITPDEGNPVKNTHPYDLKVLVIPVRNKNAVSVNFEPKVNITTLLQIKSFLQRYLPSSLRLEIVNPIYEKVKVVCTVRINRLSNDETDGYYRMQINEALQEFISPWLFGDSETSAKKKEIYIHDILDFLKERPYIESVKGFSVLHIYSKNQQQVIDGEMVINPFYAVMEDSALNPALETIKGTKPDSVLVASRNNLIYLEDGDDLPVKVEPSGIGRLTIGEEYYVKDDQEAVQLQGPAVKQPQKRYHFIISS